MLQAMIEAGLNDEPISGAGPLPYPRTVVDGAEGNSSAGVIGSGLLERDDGGEKVGENSWMPGVGRVNVTTNGWKDDQGGQCWNVTFSSAIGAVGPLSVAAAPMLSGIGASVNVEVLQTANPISGSFSLRFLSDKDSGATATSKIPHNASAETVSQALMELPGVAFVKTTRTNPTDNCADGLCRDGSPSLTDDTRGGFTTSGGGLQWTVELATRVGNTEPSSPTVEVQSVHDSGEGGETRRTEEGQFDWPQAVDNLEGEGARVEVMLLRGR